MRLGGRNENGGNQLRPCRCSACTLIGRAPNGNGSFRASSPGSENSRSAFTIGAFFVVKIGEPIRTLYEIAAPRINRGEVSIFGAGISGFFRVAEIQYEKRSRAEQVCRGRGLIFRQATERWPGRYWEARCLARSPS